MPFPILTEADLPPLKSTLERSDIDFKEQVSPKPEIEHAKDVAALASTVGGSIIIGSRTDGTAVIEYPGLPHAVAAKLPDAYEQATKDRCRPSPRVASQAIALATGNEVTVINVWPSPLAPVGVRVDPQGEDWSFPIRVGSHTRYLAPDQFGSLESVSARRAAALLLAIPEPDRGNLILRWTRPIGKLSNQAYQVIERTATLGSVQPDVNVVLFHLDASTTPTPVPLDWVATVWQEKYRSKWVVGLSCLLDGQGAALRAVMVHEAG